MIADQTRRLIDKERQTTPGRAATIPAARRGASIGIRRAFCKTDASTGSTLTCYLDTDSTGTEVTVHFQLLGGLTDLNEGHLTLADGDWIPVMQFGDDWWCLIPIEGTEEKDCG